MFMGTLLYNFPFADDFSHTPFDLAHNSLGNSRSESQNSLAIYSRLERIAVRFLAKILMSHDIPIVARFLHKVAQWILFHDSRDPYNPLEYKCIVSAARLKLFEFAGVARQRGCEHSLVNTPRKSNVTRSRASNWDAAAVAGLKTSTSGWRVALGPGSPSRCRRFRNYCKLILMRTREPDARVASNRILKRKSNCTELPL